MNQSMRCQPQIAAPTPVETVCKLMSRSALRKIGFVRPVLRFEFIRLRRAKRCAADSLASLEPPSPWKAATRSASSTPAMPKFAAPIPLKTTYNLLTTQPITQNWFRTSNLHFEIRPPASARNRAGSITSGIFNAAVSAVQSPPSIPPRAPLAARRSPRQPECVTRSD